MAEPKPPRKGPSAEELLRKWEADKKRSMVFLPLAEEYRKQDFIDSALSVLREGLKLHPNSQPAHVALGRCLLAKGQHAEAQAELERVRAKSPDNLLAGKLLAEVLEARGERRKALEVVRSLVPFGPDDPEIHERLEHLEAAVEGRVRTAPGTGDSDTSEFLTGELHVDPGPGAARAFMGDMEESRGDEPIAKVVPASTLPELAAADADPFGAAASAAASDVAAEAGRGVAAGAAGGGDSLFLGNPDDDDDTGVTRLAAAVSVPLPMPLPPEPVGDDLLGAAHAARAGGDEDEFTSLTLAELYESQGAVPEALVIYERLLASRPQDVSLRRAVDRCRPRPAPPGGGAVDAGRSPGTPGAEPRKTSGRPARWAPVTPRPAVLAPVDARAAGGNGSSRGAGAAATTPLSPAARHALQTELRRWLDAARAMRQ